METQDWYGCYDGNWRDLISKEAFAHPAKYAYGLIDRIFSFGLERGFWKAGDLIGDPFGGVATGGIVAAYKGLRRAGVELEPKFHTLGNGNIDRHRHKWECLACPVPVLLCGDSRNFASLVGPVAAVASSPPYSGNEKSDYKVNEQERTRDRDLKRGFKQGSGSFRGSEAYGQTPGQIGILPTGTVNGVVTSPPYETAIPRDGRGTDLKIHRQLEEKYSRKYSERSFPKDTYGTTDGQIGVSTGETYWTACAQVYRQCRLAVKPGGIMAVVVKSYVKDGKIVDLPEQTGRLLDSLGFAVFLRVRAWLTSETREPGLFGEDVVTVKSKKSFFRRLQEKKGSPKVDFEEVLFARRV